MDSRKLGAVLRLVGVGWYVAFCIVTGIVGGLWLDELLHTKVLFTFFGLGVGIASAFFGLYKMLVGVSTGDSDKENRGA